MQAFEKILVPIDLSENCQRLIDLATNLASCNAAKLLLCYVALPPLPEIAKQSQDEMDALILQEHAEFKRLRPADLSVAYEHLFLRGNPGPEIIKAVEEHGCDLIMLTTHGRTGMTRWLMGSVAEYVVRTAECPVMTVKIPPGAQRNPEFHNDEFNRNFSKSPFVTSAMQHVDPIHDYDEMAEVLVELKASRNTAAPVINHARECVGILTATDINRYLELLDRLEQQDESVLDEVYETDKFGMRRRNNPEFYQVKKHMTSPVVCLTTDMTCQEARRKFKDNPNIHHLIVVDRKLEPIGFVRPEDLDNLEEWNLQDPIALDK